MRPFVDPVQRLEYGRQKFGRQRSLLGLDRCEGRGDEIIGTADIDGDTTDHGVEMIGPVAVTLAERDTRRNRRMPTEVDLGGDPEHLFGRRQLRAEPETGRVAAGRIRRECGQALRRAVTRL